MDCEGKVAVVTGAAGNGMGRSIALTLARQGARVVVNYRASADSAAAIVDHIAQCGGEAIAVQADVFSASGCEFLVEEATGEFGQVDICVINPGAGWHPEACHELDAAASLDGIHAEVAPVYHLLPLVLPGMYERKWGRIVGITLEYPCASPSYSYNVAKTARTGALMKAACAAWKYGVTINVIGPGPVAPIETLTGAIEQCEHGSSWCNRTTASPQDVAESVAFLCSEAGKFITASQLNCCERS